MDATFPNFEAELVMLEAALADAERQANIDVVRDRVICPPECDPRQFGGVITQMRANGLIKKMDHVNSKRRIAHGRDVAVWEIVDIEAARNRVMRLRQLVHQRPDRAVATTRSVQKELF